MLLHYLGKLKVQICRKSEAKQFKMSAVRYFDHPEQMCPAKSNQIKYGLNDGGQTASSYNMVVVVK